MPGKRVLPKLLGLFVAITLVLFIVNQPTQAAATASGIGGWFTDAGHSIGAFLTSLAT